MRNYGVGKILKVLYSFTTDRYRGETISGFAKMENGDPYDFDVKVDVSPDEKDLDLPWIAEVPTFTYS